MEINKLTIVVGFTATLLTYWLSKAIYNLFFHPLAGFPGPRWAAASYVPEFYHDILRGGRYYKKVIQMHEEYGPIIRVNPDELSFNDPFFYDKVYSGSGQKRNKNPALTASIPTSILSTDDHDLHRQRRAYIANFFSKKSISDLESLIQSKVDKLVTLMKKAHRTEETLVGCDMFGSLASDVVSHYAYGESRGDLDKPGLPCELERDAKGLVLTVHVRRYLPVIDTLMGRLPTWLVASISPSIVSFHNFEKQIAQYSREALEKKQGEEVSTKPGTLFDALVSPKIPAPEKSMQRLKDEGILILLAGVGTTARFLTCIMCYLTMYPDVLEKLRAELQPYSNPTWSQLEALPYLTAVINEGLRYECNFTTRFPRVLVEPLAYKDRLIPSGTTIGAMPYLLNSHPDVFPDPHVFRPERWIEAKARGEYLDKYLVTFTKGNRACLGINMAYAELYLTTAAVVQNFDLELVDSSIKDIMPDRDFGLAFNKDFNFGVNFRVTKVLRD